MRSVVGTCESVRVVGVFMLGWGYSELGEKLGLGIFRAGRKSGEMRYEEREGGREGGRGGGRNRKRSRDRRERGREGEREGGRGRAPHILATVYIYIPTLKHV